MMKELKKMFEKYETISKSSEYVSVAQVVCDLHYLMQELRVKRLPKSER